LRCRGGRSAVGSGFTTVSWGAVRGRIRLHYGVAAGPAAAGAASFRPRGEAGPVAGSRDGAAVVTVRRSPSYPLRRFVPSLPAPLRPQVRPRRCRHRLGGAADEVTSGTPHRPSHGGAVAGATGHFRLWLYRANHLRLDVGLGPGGGLG